MSSAIPGHGRAVPGSDPRSAPVARVSRSALTANARSARAHGIHHYPAALLEADAWGHGAHLVREVLAAEGLRPAGEMSADRTLPAATLFGLPAAEPAGRPAMTLTGTVLAVKDLRTGEGVSYGYAYRAAADTRVALVTGGYAQGVVRTLGGAADVAIAGRRHRIVGRVAMDVCVVEIATAPVRRGDDAVFLGDAAQGEPSLAEWIDATGMTAGELITTVGLRATREEAP